MIHQVEVVVAGRQTDRQTDRDLLSPPLVSGRKQTPRRTPRALARTPRRLTSPNSFLLLLLLLLLLHQQVTVHPQPSPPPPPPPPLPQQCSSGSTEGGVVSGVGGMDCLPLRPGPFHYLISEQAKSLVALQELQNEVGALLEFRDLVIETFPNLRHKMAGSGSPGGASVIMSSSNGSAVTLPITSPSSRRITEWEPGRVRRRVQREGENSSSSLPRSRSNSHSGGNKHSATVQDSGFSTETSSKDSASTAIPRPPSPRPPLDEAEDELWNLLDVIHRRGTRLREEVECLQGRLEQSAPPAEEIDGLSNEVFEAVRKVARPEELDENPELITLRREKERLVDKITELEAETISSRVKAQELQSELEALAKLRNGLEDRLRIEIEAKNKTDILTPDAKRIVPLSPPLISSPNLATNSGIRTGGGASAFASVVKNHKNRFRTRTIEKNVLVNIGQSDNHQNNKEIFNRDNEETKINFDKPAVEEAKTRLGHLDSVLISPSKVRNVKNVDRNKIAAILHENSPLELQRHLITTTVHNQDLQERLTEAKKTSEILTERLDKTREENDDLRFQLAERNIELEGTRARVRVLERFQHRPPTELEPGESEGGGGGLCDSNSRVASDHHGCCPEPGSSTESARDHHQEMIPSPRRRPSRIPLPGSKQTAPKPPTHGRNNSRESLKSLTRQPRDSSRDSNNGKSFTKTRDSSRESLNNNNNNNNNNKSLSRSSCKDSLNKSLTRNVGTNGNNNNNNNNNNNASRDSLNKSSSSSLSRNGRDARDSLESGSPGSTPPRRPPAPARRAHSLARPSVESDTGKGFTDPPSSWCSTSGSYRHSDSSLYPDSLNQETSSVTGSTRVEFILGSPTRHFIKKTHSAVWPPRYFDSIDSAALNAESLSTDEFPLRRGEALAECDSLEGQKISSDAQPSVELS